MQESLTTRNQIFNASKASAKPVKPKRNALSNNSGWKRPLSSSQLDPTLSACPLQRVDAKSMTPFEFQRDFASLRQPVILTNLTKDWKLLYDIFKKNELIEKFKNVDVAVGSIPYGNIFGSKNGMATFSEYFQYLEKPSFDEDPFYVFDTEVIKKKIVKKKKLKNIAKLSY